MDAQTMRQTGLAAIECFNDPQRRAQYFDILYADDVVLHGYTPEPIVGKAAVREFYAQITEAFPDARVSIEAVYVDGDHLTMRFRFSGTHVGTFLGVPGTGRPFDIPGITVLRFGETRCVERWSVADFLGLLMQVGAAGALTG
ncbi:MAG: ester cyclase [Kineosporiaceae bacterium]|nr:ester cyclase [Kineosporiaceae bacterium]